MIIGVPKETKADEYRVGLLAVAAQIVDSAEEIYARAEMIVKVKEPQPAEIAMLRAKQIAFCYFHFAALGELTSQCLEAGTVAWSMKPSQECTLICRRDSR